MNIKIDSQQNNEEILVHVAGEIDVYTAPRLKEELVPLVGGENKKLTVSLKDVSYMDSTGLGLFIGLFKQLKQNDGELKLIDLSDRLKRLFEITGISNIIHISTE
ncbi:anti-sigma factor antagonist [Neobacillus mesonae]|uniref:anti-sigma factor antagonist n=1 Tax=Neobacillus mesonae TaxID=1193713 RepID=UPI00203EAE1C|nr:anti-sigma factor antagonist [Neobacillus mesonae]MCM3570987.1 anti-sigma factor antagonist [Neobacillus mesonae]